MINDLKVTTQKWERERGSGRRGTSRVRDSIPLYSIPDTLLVTNYEESHTFRSTNHGYGGVTTGSPQLDGAGPFQPPPARLPLAPQDMAAYQDARSIYPPHSLPPGTSAYVDPSMYPPHPSHTSRPPPPQPGYPVPPADYYAAAPPQSYGHDPASHIRSSPQYPGPQYSTGQYPQSRDPRDDPRYPPDYQDTTPRYIYPLLTAASNGGPASSPSQTARSSLSVACALSRDPQHC